MAASPSQPETDADVRISVVIPARNRGEQLQRCLNALAEQTVDSYEVIVVDDASDDDTTATLEQYQHSHPSFRLRTLRNDAQMGANASRTGGIEIAKGELIAFLDSDCVAAPDWLEKLASAFVDDDIAAATGRVDMPPPRNIYERTYRGTNRVAHQGDIPKRLVAGNMMIRRDVLQQFPLDTDLKYGCDEEGIFLRIQAANLTMRYVDDAVVVHEHPFNSKSFFKQAYRGGKAAAWLTYKYRLPPRLDLVPMLLGYLTLPLLFIDWRLMVVPALFFALQIAALWYNEQSRKGKSFLQTLCVMPMQIAYYHARAAGYVFSALRLYLTPNSIERI